MNCAEVSDRAVRVGPPLSEKEVPATEPGLLHTDRNSARMRGAVPACRLLRSDPGRPFSADSADRTVGRFAGHPARFGRPFGRTDQTVHPVVQTVRSGPPAVCFSPYRLP